MWSVWAEQELMGRAWGLSGQEVSGSKPGAQKRFRSYTGRAILLYKSVVVDISSAGVFVTTARVLLAEAVITDLWRHNVQQSRQVT